MLGPYGLELGHERGLVLCRQGGRGLLAPLDEERPARRAWGDGGGWGRWRCLHAPVVDVSLGGGCSYGDTQQVLTEGLQLKNAY